MAAASVHRGRKAGEAATVPCETGVGSLGVARPTVHRIPVMMVLIGQVAMGRTIPPDRYSDLLDGTAKAQPPLFY